MEVKIIGQMDNSIDHTFESANRVYDTDGLSPTINTCGGGGLQPKVIEVSRVIGGFGEKKSNNGTQWYQQDRVYEMGDIANCHPANIPGGSYNYLEVKKVDYSLMKQTVKVRKHEIDSMKLCDLLRKSKAEVKLNNKQIANALSVPITKVEHWFRRDESFSIPDAEIWFKLKDLLQIKTDKYDLAITEFEEKDGVFDKAERVYNTDGLAPTLTTISADEKIVEVKAMKDSQIVAMRGRNPDNPNSREVGLHTEQRLEPNNENISNCITTVEKDNLLMETSIIDDIYANREPRVYEEYSPSLRAERDGLKVLNIKQATKQGYIPMEVGGVLDGSFPSSKTRRGRVQGGGNICPTITAQNQELYRLEKCECNEPGAVILYMPETDQYYMVRIRKLTPRECGRLMCVNDDEISKMLNINSNTQCYRQFGNSICVDVMVAMFSNLGIDGVKKWSEVNN